ncbi:dihydrolipoyl dehydrogenase [Pararhizobium mangrovi]|uniref:Dihydrolipoyl dehydrogenase n=1 Tax=Pararhizobium mangrovi TaxID=2590452 RepID=A0A506U4M5_9HYPH|nr:dihydrolipoyl dehydrogenase [Pararhizobium mangrovi]TPW27965.1 dihydrolipoyl dehydrogenase [Pararhizobium mangrovi]
MAYDVIVIGSGPGGYVCAIKAAQLGLKTAVVEKRSTFGGTCLNIGCIPSKALLHASQMYDEAGKELVQMGIGEGKPKLDFKKMMAHKDATVKANVDGVAYLFKKNKVDTYTGFGQVLGGGKVSVTNDEGETQELEAKNVVIATGSQVAGIPGLDVEIDEKTIVSSTGALELEKVPETMIVVGAGVIGLEMGSVWARLGTKVTVVEFLDKVLGPMDGEVSEQFQRMLDKQGMDINLSSKVTAVERTEKGAKVTFEPEKGGDSQSIEADIVLVATGRKPYTEDQGMAKAGIVFDKANRIEVDYHFRTSIPNVYAIGDAVRGPMLAHKAEDEGMAVAEILAGQAGHVNYGVIPNVVYTHPEVASVGKTEEDLKKEGVEYVVGKFPFTANGRARAMLATDGFVKFLADKKTDRVLGVHIIGAEAGDMIHEACVLMEFGGSSEDLGRTCHAHPTLSEAVREAALATFAKPIHM